MKKLSYVLVGVMLLAFLFSFTVNTPLLAQEKEEEAEDVMDMALEDLLNVEITTAGKQAEKISEIPASVVVVTREDIEKYGYQSLSEILQNIPGLYVHNDWYSEKFGVRGFWTETENRNVIVLVNGISQVDDLYSGMPLEHAAVAVESIDRIEVVRGPMSVIYGTGAFFGVINIITNQVEENKPGSLVSVSYGSEKTAKVAARFAQKSGDFQYVLNASFMNTDGLDVPYLDITDAGTLADSGVVATSTKKTMEYDRKYFNLSGNFKDFYFDASYLDARQETPFFYPAVTDSSEKLFRVMRLGFGYKKNLSEKLSIDGKFTYFQTRHYYIYNMLWPNFYGWEDDGSNAFKAELNMFWNPNPKFNVTLGVTYNKVMEVFEKYNIPGFELYNFDLGAGDGAKMINQALFFQANYKLSDKFKIVAGARFEQVPDYDLFITLGNTDTTGLDPAFGTYELLKSTYSQNQIEFIPRLALIYSPNENHVLKFLYGKAINRPSLFQNQDLFEGRPTLEPEYIQTLELNYIGNLSSKFSLNFSLFRNMLDNLIYRTVFFEGGAYADYHANVGEMTTNGAELTLTAKPGKGFFLELSGMYQDTKDKRPGFEDIEVAFSPKFLGYLKASYFFNKNISLAVTGNYVGEMESYWDNVYEVRSGDKAPSYFLLGANLRIRDLFGKGVYLNIRGSNLLDEEVRYGASPYSWYAYKGTMGRGLTFQATIGMEFK